MKKILAVLISAMMLVNIGFTAFADGGEVPSDTASSKSETAKEETSKEETKNKYTKDAEAKEDDYNASVYEKITSYVENPLKDKENPVIYLYNTPRSHARLLYIIKPCLSTLFLYFFDIFSFFRILYILTKTNAKFRQNCTIKNRTDKVITGSVFRHIFIINT